MSTTKRAETPARIENVEAEQAVLGAALQRDAGVVRLLLEKIKPDEFSRTAHRIIYRALIALDARGILPDLISLTEELTSSAELGKCGGAAYVSRLTSAVPTSANAEYYAGIVHTLAQKRTARGLSEDFESGKLELADFVDQVSALKNGRGKAKEIKLLGVTEILEYPPVEYVVEPYLPAGAVVNLTAYTGTGKSVLATALAISAMSGLPFLGKFSVRKQGSVLYLDEETPRSYLKDRLQKMRLRIDDPFLCAHFTGLKLDNDQDFATIRALVEKHHPVLVIFDTLIRFHCADENSASEMAIVMGRLRELANLGPCILVQIHQSKVGELRTRSRGSSDIVGACDLELALTEKDHGLLTLQSVKSRMAPVEPLTLRIQEIDGRLEITEADDWSREQSDALEDMLAETADGLSITALWGKLKEQGIEIGRMTVVRRVEAMADRLVFSTGARNQKLYRMRPENA